MTSVESTLSEAVRMLFSPMTLFAMCALLFLTAGLGFEVGTFVGFAEYRDSLRPAFVPISDLAQFGFKGSLS
jgi:hypothetical protein